MHPSAGVILGRCLNERCLDGQVLYAHYSAIVIHASLTRKPWSFMRAYQRAL